MLLEYALCYFITAKLKLFNLKYKMFNLTIFTLGFYGRPWTTEQRKDLFQK